ncbi:MAG: DUF805 domain-containing protein [Paracoccaceae bacterium]
MTIVEATRSCFRKYLIFSGRASRSEFWKFVLFLILATVLLVVVNTALFGPTITRGIEFSVNQDGQQTQYRTTNHNYEAGWLGSAFQLLTTLPLLSAMWRRMHDIGRPGWHVLLPIPIFALSFLIVYFTSIPMPVDQSAIPGGLELPITVRVPQSPVLFVISWLMAFSSIVLVTVWLARRSKEDPDKSGGIPAVSEAYHWRAAE